ncbi:MAG: hypothetical protein R2729_30550 [Bryobacteraceae bacterium]
MLNILGSTYQTYRANTFQSRRIDARTLEWQIPLDAPGILTTRIIRLTNIRVNASQFVPSGQSTAVHLLPTSPLYSW